MFLQIHGISPSHNHSSLVLSEVPCVSLKIFTITENVVSSGTLSLLEVPSCHSWMDAHPHYFHENCSFQELGPIHPQPQSPRISIQVSTGIFLRLQLLSYISETAKKVLMLFLQVPFTSWIFRHKEFLNSTLHHKSSFSYILCSCIPLCSQQNPCQNSHRV